MEQASFSLPGSPFYAAAAASHHHHHQQQPPSYCQAPSAQAQAPPPTSAMLSRRHSSRHSSRTSLSTWRSSCGPGARKPPPLSDTVLSSYFEIFSLPYADDSDAFTDSEYDAEAASLGRGCHRLSSSSAGGGEGEVDDHSGCHHRQRRHRHHRYNSLSRKNSYCSHASRWSYSSHVGAPPPHHPPTVSSPPPPPAPPASDCQRHLPVHQQHPMYRPTSRSSSSATSAGGGDGADDAGCCRDPVSATGSATGSGVGFYVPASDDHLNASFPPDYLVSNNVLLLVSSHLSIDRIFWPTLPSHHPRKHGHFSFPSLVVALQEHCRRTASRFFYFNNLYYVHVWYIAISPK